MCRALFRHPHPPVAGCPIHAALLAAWVGYNPSFPVAFTLPPEYHPSMRAWAPIALLPLFCLLGCALPNAIPASANSPSSPLAGNWQIQSGTAITSPPTGFYLVGAIQGQNSQLTGIFTGTVPCTPPVDNLTGSFNTATSVLTLSQFAGFQLTLPAVPNTLASGTIGGGGFLCLAMIGPTPAVGVQIAPLNGTYSGTFTDSASPGMSGTGTLTLTQSATPNADGSFSLTGTVTFPSNSGLGAYTLSGTIGGEGITLYDPTPGIVPVVSLTASTNPAATQIAVGNLAFAVTASDIVTFTGTLTLQ